MGFKMQNSKGKLIALMIQYMNGRDREPIYSAFWEIDGKENRTEIERFEFWNLCDSAGEPVYSEPNYWVY